jgi:hypothetical protein
MSTEQASSHATQQDDDRYDDSLPPLWQSVIELGASLPAEVWDQVPSDLASNLDHYLYGKSGKEE